jgi:hypothetical protein
MHLDLDKLGDAFPQKWDDKSGKAAEFTSQDSQYRLYQPDTKPASGGGLLVYVKMDHIRGNQKDDHAQVTVEFDKEGKLVSTTPQVQLADDPDIPSSVIRLATMAAIGGLTALDAAAVQVVARTYNKLAEQMSDITDDGGRMNFPAVIAHMVNTVSGCINVN